MEIICRQLAHKKIVRNDGEAGDVALASQVHNLFYEMKLPEAQKKCIFLSTLTVDIFIIPNPSEMPLDFGSCTS